MTKKGQALSVLIVSTFAFTVCFMVWTVSYTHLTLPTSDLV